MISKQFTMDFQIFDKNLNLLKTYQSLRYLKIAKNSIFDNNPIYNQYQFIVEIPSTHQDLMDHDFIYKIKINFNDNIAFDITLKITKFDIIETTDISIVYNCIAVGFNVYRFLFEEIISRAADYDRIFSIYKIPHAPFSTSIYSFLTTGIFKVMDILYGPFQMYNRITSEYINETSLPINNLPLLNNYDLLKYYFNNLYPVLDYYFFSIDDMVPIESKVKPNKKLILNTFQNILNNQNVLEIDDKNLKIARTQFLGTIIDIHKTKIEPLAKGNYLIYDIDHPKIQIGPKYLVPRDFNGEIKFDNVQSLYDVQIDYSMSEVLLDKLRDNYSSFTKMDLKTYLFKFTNIPPSFLNINSIFKIDDVNYYIYGGNYEFSLFNRKNSFKLEATVKTLKFKNKKS